MDTVTGPDYSALQVHDFEHAAVVFPAPIRRTSVPGDPDACAVAV